MRSLQERVDESRRELGDGGTGVHFHGNELIAEETAPDGGRARDSRRRFEPASPLPCGARVAAAPSDLDSGQWRGSSCAVRPMSGPWAGRSGTPCADLVVQGARSGRRVSSAGGRAPVRALGSGSPQVCTCPGIRTSGCLPCQPPGCVNPSGSQD